MSFGIAYKEDPTRPATQGGRTIAYDQLFSSREIAQSIIREMNLKGVHVIETKGEVTAVFPKVDAETQPK